ncbi:MAG TPA: hypothetical protein VFR23_04260 [Jiangellaceae bacterium]|nr:hypothetical protein [Jiangellaceae bacterium]
MTAKTTTPGYNRRLGIFFQANKNGQRVAYYWSFGAGRAIRMSLANAELFIATDQADLLPGHPIRGC